MAHFARISDPFMWPHNNGTFSVKSASKFLFHQQQVPLNKLVWNWICPKKDPTFLLESYAQPTAHQIFPNYWAQPFG